MTTRRVAFWAATSFWFLFGLINGTLVWISMLSHGHNVPRLLSYHILVWIAWVGVTYVIGWLARKFPVVPLSRKSIVVHAIAATVIGIVHSFFWVGMMLWLQPYDRMTAEPSELRMVRLILFSRLPLEWLLYCLALGGALAFEYYDRYRQGAVRAAQLEKSLADARLHALELQIQPHFLFNTLNAISSLVRTKRNEEAVEMMAGLSELLRYTLDHAGDQRVTLGEEIAVLRRYLEIQRVRFPDRMTYCVEVTAEAERAKVPTLLLQPLAENAVRHGIAMSASEGVVEIRAKRRGDSLDISVFNSGNLDKSSPQGIGLRNTIERLQHLYGGDARFAITNGNGGVTASISIPWSEVA
jgi:anti-sigma regulatory factor (Ser/Thr protein kinase)